MSGALAVATRKRESGAAAVQHDSAHENHAENAPQQAGVPRWLQHRAASAAGDDGKPRLQHKCAACAAGGAPCPACEEKERLQRKEQAGAGTRADRSPARMHALAHDGVKSASAPLPHFHRIQAAFGRHDLSDVKAEVGGPAGEANARMGSLGYTLGDRVGFRAEPDLRLAAHEAAHVVQQRGDVQLKDGIGRPGDGYEQQADAAADAVERGASAEPLLDRPPVANVATPALARKSAESDEAPVQHRLMVNATRLFEPPAPRASAARGAGGAPAPSGAPGEGGGAESTAPAAEEPDAAAEAEADMPPEADAAAPPEGGGAGGGGAAPQGEAQQPACNGPGDMHCYTEPAEDPPEGTEEQEPPEPAGGQSKKESRGDSEELPEVDECPAQKALATQPAAQPAAVPAAAAPPSAAAPGAAPAPGAAAAEGGAPAEAAAPAGGAPGGGAAGGAGGGTEGGGMTEAAAPSEFDAGLAQAEGQRDAAVSAYTASSMALAGAANGTRALRASTPFTPADESSAEAIRSSEATTRVNRFFSAAADRLDSAIAFATTRVPDRLGAQAETDKAALAAAIETQKSAISTRIEQARGQAIADAATARDEVLLQAEAFVNEAEAQTTTAIEALQASHAAALEQVNELETTTLERVNKIYADGRTAHEALGVTVGDECISRGEEFAAFYLKHKNNGGCWTDEKDSFFKGYLTQRRAEAQANAARETAKGYRDSLIDSAKSRAREVIKNGRRADRCAVIAAASSARDQLDQQFTSIKTALEVARDATIRQAGESRDSLVNTIETNLAATLHQLNRQEHDQRQAVDDAGYMQQLTQEQTAHATAAALQQSVVDAVSAAQSGLAMVQAQLAGNAAPDLAMLEAVLAQVARKIDGAVGNLETGLESGTAGGETQLAGAAQQGIATLESATQSSDDLATATQDGFCTAMSNIAGNDNFAALRSGFTQQQQQTAAGGAKALEKAVGGMREACDAVTKGSETSLGQSATDLEKSLRDSKQGLECDIPKRADEAASREAPAWKRVLAIVLVILVIVIMVVVTIVTFGAGGIVAGIIVGAIVGALTSAMLTVASNLWNNQSVTKGVFKAALTGFIMGAIGGGLGAWMGGALQAANITSRAAIVAANLGLAAGLNIGFQFVTGGLSFENFSFEQLGLTLVTALVFSLIGMKYGGRIQIGGPKQQPAPAAPPPPEPPAPTPAPVPAPSGPPRLTVIKGGGGGPTAAPTRAPVSPPAGGGGPRSVGANALKYEPLPAATPAPTAAPAPRHLSVVPEPAPVTVPPPAPATVPAPAPATVTPPAPSWIVPTSTGVGIAAGVIAATEAAKKTAPSPGPTPGPTPVPVPGPAPVPAPGTKPKPKTDACLNLWQLGPGTNARRRAQRAPIAGNITVDWASFRLDAGISPPAGQFTNPACRLWARGIGLPKDDAGHVIARRFGGSAAFNSAAGNIFPQDLSFNRGAMVQMDRVAADLHQAGCDVCVKITLAYASPTDLRPEGADYEFMYRSPGMTGFNPIIGPARIPNP